MNRIDQTFKNLKRNKRKAFIAYITAGDPNLTMTERLVLALAQNGVDIIELGVPFSDPMADGPTIQAASERALKNNVNLNSVFTLVENIRKKSDIPIALMTYYNPILHYGEKSFVTKAVKAGVDGVIVPDLPPEEGKVLTGLSRKAGLSTIFFLAPTTRPERIKTIAKASTGFIYYVSVTGITGTNQKLVFSDIGKHIERIKKATPKPVCIGFGVATPADVRAAAKAADGVIVGSAIIKEILKNKGKKDLVTKVSRFVKSLTKELS